MKERIYLLVRYPKLKQLSLSLFVFVLTHTLAVTWLLNRTFAEK